MALISIPEIPKSMKSRPRDKRGLPIPFTTTILKDGTPDFRIVDASKAYLAATKRLCALSGKKLNKKTGAWFIGGPLSAFSPIGLYLDPAMEPENAVFALKTCPYLAVPKFTEKEFKEKKGGYDGQIVVEDVVTANRPDVFVAVHALKWDIVPNGGGILFSVSRPFEGVSFWVHGKQISHEEAMSLTHLIPDRAMLKHHTKGIYGPATKSE